MKIETPNSPTELIINSLKNAINYEDYRALVRDLVAKNESTGETQNEALANYTMLNDRRMKRWDKTVKLSENQIERIKSISKKSTWVVLTESWCGDAAHQMPVMQKIAELNPNISFKVVLRDENEALMDAFLTNGNKAIPKLIMIDENFNVTGSYGPRPSGATALVNDYKETHGKLTPEFKEDLQRWYNTDKGQNTINDLIELL